MTENTEIRYGCCKHPLISRFNSWLLAVYEKPFHEETGSMKTERMKDLEGTVVELGPGNGINFRYYPKGVKVIAVEPNPFMYERLGEHAKIYQTDVEVKACYLEDLQLEDDSIDAVVCSLVLCTVPDQEGTLEEILRILKPGGRFVFLEHVAAADGSIKRKLQNLLVRPWKWLFDGCVTNRDTGSLLNRVGFSHVEMEAFDSKSMPPPISPSIVGVATK